MRITAAAIDVIFVLTTIVSSCRIDVHCPSVFLEPNSIFLKSSCPFIPLLTVADVSLFCDGRALEDADGAVIAKTFFRPPNLGGRGLRLGAA